jgi:hypothetical protein
MADSTDTTVQDEKDEVVVMADVDNAIDNAIDDAIDVSCPIADSLIAEVASRFSRNNLCRLGLNEPRFYCLIMKTRQCCRFAQISARLRAQIIATCVLSSCILRGAAYIREKRRYIAKCAVEAGLDKSEVMAALIKYRNCPRASVVDARRAFSAELRDRFPTPADCCGRCAWLR